LENKRKIEERIRVLEGDHGKSFTSPSHQQSSSSFDNKYKPQTTFNVASDVLVEENGSEKKKKKKKRKRDEEEEEEEKDEEEPAPTPTSEKKKKKKKKRKLSQGAQED